MPKRSSDDFDNDNTDELPILLETVVLVDEPMPSPVPAEDTSEHTALYPAAEHSNAGISARYAELAEHAAQTRELEAELATLTNRARELERRLLERDQLIGELRHTVATLRESADAATSAERRLATQLAVRDARIAEATATIEQLHRESAARSSEIEQLRMATEEARRAATAAQHELAARPAPASATHDLDKLLEENAALKDYVAGRQTWWNESQARQASLGENLTALQNELTASKKELAAAEAFAARESQRAVALRAELVTYARRAADLERELRAERQNTATRPPAAPAPVAPISIIDAPSKPMPATEPAAPPQPKEEPEAIDTSAAEPDAAAIQAIAQLEAEVGYKRQQVAAQLVELRERDQRLQTAAADIDRLRRELSTMRNEFDESRSTAARLERTIIDKDRALEARDARIATLQEELKQRMATLDKRSAIELPARPDTTATRASIDAGGDHASAPALLCLTGDAPKRFPLTKKTIVVGRGPHCDLQIVTHFVSREHARVTLSGSSVVIEDLGSRNGVYVNGVRVDRHGLQQGDLVTIGETQFRFMESMAH